MLLIAIDDLRTELGCYGLPYVDSPHLAKDQAATAERMLRLIPDAAGPLRR